MIKLRDLLHTDNEHLVHYLNMTQVIRYLSSRIPYPYTESDADWWLTFGSKEQSITQAITHKDQFCGTISILKKIHEYAHTAEIGYWVAPQFWGQGIATRAVIEFTEFVFSSTDIHRITNSVVSPNLASMRVMSKAGYTMEAVLKDSAHKHGHFYDEHLYVKLRGR